MGPKDPDRKEETNVRHEEEKEIKTGKSKLDSHFEKLKTEKSSKSQKTKNVAKVYDFD